MNKVQQKLKDWFLQEKRDFPWRRNPTPYKVWVSEVMLQQTRAGVVVNYFEKWMNRFPTIQALAEASIEDVIKTWEGLGYYSRARNLHAGAKCIIDHHKGIFPSDIKTLFSIKGIGPYTAGAILNFAFHQKALAIDGNVMRVTARLFSIKKNIHFVATQKIIGQYVSNFLPDQTSWILMEALIELGAKICKKKPLCFCCPLSQHCLAFQKGLEKELPITSKMQKAIVLHRYVPLIYYGKEYLVQYHRGKKIMADLYEFPYFSNEKEVKCFFPMELIHKGKLKKMTHAFTKYRAHLFPEILEAKEKKEIQGFLWIPLDRLIKLPFSSGHRKVLQQLIGQHAISTY